MAKGTNKSLSIRQITHTRLYDDGILETKYEILNKLGEGSFGTVSRVRNKETNMFYAMKTIAKKPGNKSKATSLDNEVKLLKEVNHPNLIQLHEVLESSQNLYLIVELCEGGELGKYVKNFGPLPELTVKQIISKLVNALYYLHRMDIVHRDLKLENILLKNTPISKTDEFDIRITDFGLSSKKSIISTDSLFNDYCGTPLYMAPEILENKNYSALCDVWALGIIMFYLFCARHPYVANDERRLLEVIRSQKLRFDSEKFQNLSSEGLDFLQGMLIYDTVHRRTMGELTVHPWLTGRSDKGPNKDIITMMKEFHAETDHRRIIDEKATSSSMNNERENENLFDKSLNEDLPTKLSSPCQTQKLSSNSLDKRTTTTNESKRSFVRSNHLTPVDPLKNTRRSTTQLNSSDSPSISRSQPQRMKSNDLNHRICSSSSSTIHSTHLHQSHSTTTTTTRRTTTNESNSFPRSQSQSDLLQ